jgi:hypothetical protein
MLRSQTFQWKKGRHIIRAISLLTHFSSPSMFLAEKNSFFILLFQNILRSTLENLLFKVETIFLEWGCLFLQH